MVYLVGASSLTRGFNKAPTSIWKRFRGKAYAVPGLGFHPTAKNLEKQLQKHVEKCLKTCENIVIWHDLVNISLFSHKSNGNRRRSPEFLLNILECLRNRSKAIIYNQKIGTPNIYKSTRSGLIRSNQSGETFAFRSMETVILFKNCGSCTHLNALDSILIKRF